MILLLAALSLAALIVGTLNLSLFPVKAVSCGSVSCVEAVDIRMDPLCQRAAHGHDAAPVIFCMLDGDRSQTIVKVSYPEVQCFGKPAAYAAQEPEQDGIDLVSEGVWRFRIGIDCFQEPPALIFRINMGDMVACRVVCPDIRQICMASPLRHEFRKPIQKDFLTMQSPVSPSLPIDK